MTDIHNLQAFALYMQKTDIKFDLFSVTKEMEKQVNNISLSSIPFLSILFFLKPLLYLLVMFLLYHNCVNIEVLPAKTMTDFEILDDNFLSL